MPVSPTTARHGVLKYSDLEPSEFARRIPTDFTIGVATSAFQIEGAVNELGRGTSTWDSFMTKRGNISDGSTATVAADHVHRFRDDLALLTQLGVDEYRFSLSWPRLQPTGTGELRATGLAFYNRLIDELLEAGIRPMATLFHWDTPLELERAGGWLTRETARRFADFAHKAATAFGDRVANWVTMHEPATVVIKGYALGEHAPGHTLLFDALPAAHNLLLGHGLAVQAIRATGARGGVGITNVHTPVIPDRNRMTDRYFAGLVDLVHNRIFADPVLLGRYPKAPFGSARWLRALADADSIYTDEADLDTIRQPLDFYGVSYYQPTRVKATSPRANSGRTTPGRASNTEWTDVAASLPFSAEPFPEFTAAGNGRPIAPRYLAVTFKELAERYGVSLPPVFVTQSGVCLPDTFDEFGVIHDPQRIEYVARHLAVALDGTPGIDVRGFFTWSLLDSWEWNAGFSQRFGLVHVDFETLDRTPKDSFRWLQAVQAAR